MPPRAALRQSRGDLCTVGEGAAITAHHGYEVKTIGDAFMVAFDRADYALACAVAIQASLAAPVLTRDGWTVHVRIRN